MVVENWDLLYSQRLGLIRVERKFAEVLVVMDAMLQVCINAMAKRRNIFSTRVSNSAVKKCPTGF